MPETYRGSIKHKDRPARGRKGTLCPDWTHRTADGKRLGTEMDKHAWDQTEAHRLFMGSRPCPEGSGRRFATSRGMAFVAVSTNDGTWHGYPVPWNDVPSELKSAWQSARLVSRRDLARYLDRPKDDIRWALESDDEE